VEWWELQVDHVTLDIQRDALLGIENRRGGKRSKAIFIAYRMNDPDSRSMRSSLAESIQEIDSDVVILDGKVSQGLPWANEVRGRIGRSQLLVIDVTGPSREVMFEMGFASNKPFIPIVHRQEDLDSLPAWLTAFQIPAFAETGLPRLAAEIVTIVRTQLPKPALYRRPPAVPGMVTWLQDGSSIMFGDAYQRISNLAQRYSLKVLKVDSHALLSYDDLRQLLRSWMVISCMDGRPSDHAGHFFLGDIAGRRRAGSGSGRGQSLQRRGVALVPTARDLSLLVADSVRRVSRSVLMPLTTEDALEEIEPIFASYRKWLLSDLEEL
jgi:hypothetical protein